MFYLKENEKVFIIIIIIIIVVVVVVVVTYLLQLGCHSVAVVHALDTDKTNKNKYT
jgi:flagellar basal body-associated protein FliL